MYLIILAVGMVVVPLEKEEKEEEEEEEKEEEVLVLPVVLGRLLAVAAAEQDGLLSLASTLKTGMWVSLIHRIIKINLTVVAPGPSYDLHAFLPSYYLLQVSFSPRIIRGLRYPGSE